MNGGLKTLNNIIKAGVSSFAIKSGLVSFAIKSGLASFAIKSGMEFFALKKAIEEDANASEEDYAFTLGESSKFRINYEKDWIVDSGCEAHMTGDIKMLDALLDHKGHPYETRGVNGSLSAITQVGSTIVSLKSDNYKLPLQPVYQVEGLNCNIISVSQLTSLGYFVLFGPQDVKLYHELEISEEPVIKGRMVQSTYTYILDDVKSEN